MSLEQCQIHSRNSIFFEYMNYLPLVLGPDYKLKTVMSFEKLYNWAEGQNTL